MRSALADPAYRAFVRHVVALRAQANITQRELAKRLDRPPSYVDKTERYERRMDPSEFCAIVGALGFDPAAEFAAVVAQNAALQ